MSPGDRSNAAKMPGPAPTWTDVCPPVSLLRRIGDDEIAEDLYIRLERHIETCPECQSILQNWADTDRLSAGPVESSTSIDDLIGTDEFEAVPAIPGFRMIRELGRGGEGVVYLAEEIETQRLVALKFLPGGWLADPEGRKRWLRQVRATARIQHTNVVRLYRIEETSRWYVMVLEYVSGGTLRERARKPLATADAAALVQRLALAVDEIHSAGVWHLDLKPSNVLLDGAATTPLEKCVPKISDFGIAMRNELAANEPSNCGGTPAFMAPEQTERGARQLGPATDVYGLGAILYYCLTAQPPFEGSSAGESIFRVRNEPLRFPEDSITWIDPRLIAICRKSMAKAPSERFSNPGVLAKELGKWIDSNSSDEQFLRDSKPAGVSVNKRIAISLTLFSTVVLASVMVPGMRWISFGTRQGIEAPLTKTEWIQELRRIEPSVFFGTRLHRLIASSRYRTNEILSTAPGDPEEMARIGMMLQATAARFCSSLDKDLFESADDLLECSVRLLEKSHELAPGNQVTIRELAIAEFSFGNVKDKDLEADEAAVIIKFQEDVRHLARASFWIDRIEDRRSRVHVASLILDRAREQAWNAKLKGLSKAAAVWNAFHRKCESQWSDLADSEEIRLRMALFDRREFSPEKSSGTDRDSTTLDLKSRLNLERELVMYRLEPLVFRPDEIQADPNDDEIGMVLTEAEGLLKRMGRDPALILSIAYEDLIRPVSAVSTWMRSQGKWSEAKAFARRYRRIVQRLNVLHPERFECCLALSESYLQDWKNALKAEDPAGAEASLRVSLDMARRATHLAPGEVKARVMLEDRESRLARFQSDR